MCFVVDPAWRGRGVGTALLAGALAAFRAEGVQTVEAFPRPEPVVDATPGAVARAAYEGPLPTYLKAGFEVVGPGAQGSVVVRTTL